MHPDKGGNDQAGATARFQEVVGNEFVKQLDQLVEEKKQNLRVIQGAASRFSSRALIISNQYQTRTSMSTWTT